MPRPSRHSADRQPGRGPGGRPGGAWLPVLLLVGQRLFRRLRGRRAADDGGPKPLPEPSAKPLPQPSAKPSPQPSAKPPPEDRPSAHRHPTATATAVRSLRRAADRAGGAVVRLGSFWRPQPIPEPDEPPPPPIELVRFLRECGTALCLAGETTDRVQQVIVELGERYGMHQVHALVLPTGVFVRVGDGPGAVVDFAPVRGEPLGLDQVGELYRFLEELYDHPMPPEEGTERLRRLKSLPPRFPVVLRVLGYTLLTIGLGLITYPSQTAVLGYAVLGVAVGALRELVGGPLRMFSLALPVIAAVLVTVLAYRYSGPLLGENPTKLVIPPLLAFLPGAALTMGMMELSAGSMVSGTSRLAYGLSTLVLLVFGITVGTSLMRLHPVVEGADADAIGSWAPWAGVLLLGVGHALNSSAPLRTLPWLLLVLAVAEAVQLLGQSFSDAVLGAFLGGATLPLIARIVESRRGAPPAQVTFLPAFWMLVPGSLTLTGVGELIAGDSSHGLLTSVNALLTVVAVALGVMVGASLLRGGRAMA
ncbi:threonine/serine exporter family protein [Streptomyces sp. NPDC051940]|uniref:threonine/serine exporter family protein n=1 Tax=Streptomyces sp. NPDC051940 TaxID=3155675 RepID=UPI00342363F4